jgi:hypothetical protein
MMDFITKDSFKDIEELPEHWQRLVSGLLDYATKVTLLDMEKTGHLVGTKKQAYPTVQQGILMLVVETAVAQHNIKAAGIE